MKDDGLHGKSPEIFFRNQPYGGYFTNNRRIERKRTSQTSGLLLLFDVLINHLRSSQTRSQVPIGPAFWNIATANGKTVLESRNQPIRAFLVIPKKKEFKDVRRNTRAEGSREIAVTEHYVGLEACGELTGAW